MKKESPVFYNALAEASNTKVDVSPTDIMTFNSSTFKPQTHLKTQEQKDSYAQFLKDKDAVM